MMGIKFKPAKKISFKPQMTNVNKEPSSPIKSRKEITSILEQKAHEHEDCMRMLEENMHEELDELKNVLETINNQVMKLDNIKLATAEVHKHLPTDLEKED